MPATGALTKRIVTRARYEPRGNGKPGHCVIWDSEVRGFGLRIWPSGTKGFVLFYRTPEGRKRLLTIGAYPDLTVDEAKRIARARLFEVASGKDPVEERRRIRAESITFGELADLYLEHHARVHKKSARDDEQRIEDYLRPAWGGRPAASIRRADVADVHLAIGKKAHYAANRTVSLVSKIFNWASVAGLIPEDRTNPARGIVRYKERSRDRFLSPEEAGRLLRAIDAETGVYIRSFFWLALLLGTRKGELLGARWDDVDLTAGVLTIAETKAARAGRRSRAHHLPLSKPAMGILEALPREKGNPYVFPGSREGEPLVNVENAWRRARTAAKLPGVRFHDLRRTVGSWLAQRGATLGLVGAVLNHSQPQTTAIYARFGERDTRHVLETHGAAVLKAARHAAGRS
jgi:integrase